MADRNTISQVVESLFEDWIDRNINVHPLAVENMRILEADALSLLKEQEAVEPFIQISEHTGRKWLTCGACEYQIESEKESWEEINFCPKCGRPILWEGR